MNLVDQIVFTPLPKDTVFFFRSFLQPRTFYRVDRCFYCILTPLICLSALRQCCASKSSLFTYINADNRMKFQITIKFKALFIIDIHQSELNNVVFPIMHVQNSRNVIATCVFYLPKMYCFVQSNAKLRLGIPSNPLSKYFISVIEPLFRSLVSEQALYKRVPN